MSEQHTLYRFKDKRGRLLYVGITNDPCARMKQHRAEKSWWNEVAVMEMEHHVSRDELAQAEREAIRSELPYWNSMHDATTLDAQLGILLGATALCCSALKVTIPDTIGKGALFEIDKILNDHPGLIPVIFEVTHQSGAAPTGYPSLRATNLLAVAPLSELLGAQALDRI